MSDLDPIRDLRFQGFDIPELLQWIGKIKEGRGTESMEQAATALQQCAQIVADLDETLRTELGKLEIEWQGHAGSIAQQATAQQTAVMRESQDPLANSATGVQAQGRGYESARNTLPNQSEIQHQKDENFFEWAGGAFGYTSDYDEEAKKIDGQKQVAQQALGSYRDTTVAQADAFQPLPEMQPAGVSAQSASPSGAGGSGVGAFSGAGGGSGSGGYSESGGAFGGGYPGAVPGQSGGQRPGGHSGSSLEDEQSTGGGVDRAPGEAPQQDGIGLGGALGIGAGGAAVAGIGAAAAGKLLGGKGATPGSGSGGGSGAAGGGGKSGGSLKGGGSSGVGGGPGDTTAGRTAGGSATSRPGPGSMMGPAATRGGQPDDDAEHEDKYYEPETPFDDNRLVAPPVFGADRAPDDDERE